MKTKYIIQYKHKDGALGTYYGCEKKGILYMTAFYNEAYRFDSKEDAKDFIFFRLNSNKHKNKGKYIVKKYKNISL